MFLLFIMQINHKFDPNHSADGYPTVCDTDMSKAEEISLGVLNEKVSL